MRNLFSSLLAVFLTFSFNYIDAQSEHTCSQKGKYLSGLDRATGLKSGAMNNDEYDVHFYKLDLEVENNSVFIKGNVTILSTVSAIALDTFVCELHQNMSIDSILFNGQNTTFTHSQNTVKIPTGTTLNFGSKMEVTVFYSGTAPSSGSSAIGQGLSTQSSPTWGNSVTWSLSQPYSAYEWFPVKQELQDKADSVEVWITTSNQNKAGSNGVLQAITPMPNNKDRYEWKSTYPISYYLISLAVAEYDEYTIYAKPSGLNDSIEIVNYIYNNPGTLPQFKSEIDKTVTMLNEFSDKFGIYPFHEEKYGHCMAPFSGGMEHQTMTTQGFFVTDLTSHELAHQWFGDDVTCASWKDIAMNEGFASYLEYVYIENYEPIRIFSWISSTYSSALRPTGSVYVDDTTDVSRIFSSSLTYNKGAYLLHMLRHEINDDAVFFSGLSDYRSKFSGGNVTGLDFKAEMEMTTGTDFTYFFDQWYFGEGYPVFDVTYNKVNDVLYLTFDETVTSPSITPFFKTYIDVLLPFSDRQDTTIRLNIDQSSKSFVLPGITGALDTPIVNPMLTVLCEIGSLVEDPSLGVGIEESGHGGQILIYPNPARDFVTIELNGIEKNSEVLVNILDNMGRKIRSTEFNNDSPFRIQTSGLSPGNYIIEVRTGDASIHRKKLIVE